MVTLQGASEAVLRCRTESWNAVAGISVDTWRIWRALPSTGCEGRSSGDGDLVRKSRNEQSPLQAGDIVVEEGKEWMAWLPLEVVVGNTCILVADHVDIWENQYNIVKLKKKKKSCHLVPKSCLSLCDPMDFSPPDSMGFSWQEHWCGLPFPLSGAFHYSGIKPVSPTLAGTFSITESPGKPSVGIGRDKNFWACWGGEE